MSIGSYSWDEFAALAKSFHGSVAPGILLGGCMGTALRQQLPANAL